MLVGALQTIFKFLRHPHKPVILAMSRPDAKKNIHTLVKAFGEHKRLRQLANLVLIMVRHSLHPFKFRGCTSAPIDERTAHIQLAKQ